MPKQTFTAVIEFDKESGKYIGSVPQLPGAFTQGATIEELRKNLIEVVELVLEELAANGEHPEFADLVGTEQVTVEM